MFVLKAFLATVLVLGVLIFVHELGHFIAARIFGVKVNEFAVGMGPKIFSRRGKKSGTIYSLRIFPIGGFNNIEGEDSESSDSGSFRSKPVWQRIIIIVSGAAMNIFFGMILMSVLVMLKDTQLATNQVSFPAQSEGVSTPVSYDSGLRSGDRIIRINNKKIHIGQQLSYAIFFDGSQPCTVTVIRDGNKLVMENFVFPTSEQGGIVHGVRDFYPTAEAKTPFTVAKHSFYGSINSVRQALESLWGIITGKYGIKQVSGPVGITEAIGQAANMGLQYILLLSVMISMSLGIFNLLPIPALDGGRVIFLIIEGIRRKPVPPELEAKIHATGLMLLFMLSVVIAFKDIFVLATRFKG